MEKQAVRPIPTDVLRHRIAAAVLISLLAAGVVAGVTIWAISHPPQGYRRYVSAPLPDGSRYTLLIPRRMQTSDGLSAPGAPMITVASDSGRLGAVLNSFRRRVGLPWHSETLTVAYLSWSPTGRTAGGAMPLEYKTSRQETMGHARVMPAFHGVGGISIDHISIGEGPEFEKNAPVIMNSFRLLAPGEAVPTGH